MHRDRHDLQRQQHPETNMGCASTRNLARAVAQTRLGKSVSRSKLDITRDVARTDSHLLRRRSNCRQRRWPCPFLTKRGGREAPTYLRTDLCAHTQYQRTKNTNGKKKTPSTNSARGERFCCRLDLSISPFFCYRPPPRTRTTRPWHAFRGRCCLPHQSLTSPGPNIHPLQYTRRGGALQFQSHTDPLFKRLTNLVLFVQEGEGRAGTSNRTYQMLNTLPYCRNHRHFVKSTREPPPASNRPYS